MFPDIEVTWSHLHFMKKVNLQFSKECLLIPLMFIIVHEEGIHNPSVLERPFNLNLLKITLLCHEQSVP